MVEIRSGATDALATRHAFAEGQVVPFNINLRCKYFEKLFGYHWLHRKLVFLRICVSMEKNKGKGQGFESTVSMGKMPVFETERNSFHIRMS